MCSASRFEVDATVGICGSGAGVVTADWVPLMYEPDRISLVVAESGADAVEGDEEREVA